MATGDYIQKSSAEWNAVDRWENEGGQLGQNYNYRWHMDQVTPIESVGRRDRDSARDVRSFWEGEVNDRRESGH